MFTIQVYGCIQYLFSPLYKYIKRKHTFCRSCSVERTNTSTKVTTSQQIGQQHLRAELIVTVLDGCTSEDNIVYLFVMEIVGSGIKRAWQTSLHTATTFAHLYEVSVIVSFRNFSKGKKKKHTSLMLQIVEVGERASVDHPTTTCGPTKKYAQKWHTPYVRRMFCDCCDTCGVCCF